MDIYNILIAPAPQAGIASYFVITQRILARQFPGIPGCRASAPIIFSMFYQTFGLFQDFSRIHISGIHICLIFSIPSPPSDYCIKTLREIVDIILHDIKTLSCQFNQPLLYKLLLHLSRSQLFQQTHDMLWDPVMIILLR